MISRPLVFAALAFLALASCGDGDKSDGAASSTPTTASADGGEASGPLPYLLLNAEGWTLDGGASSGPMIQAGASLGLKWNAAYTSWPEPNHELGAALAVSDPPNGGAQEFAALLTSGDAREVSIGGHRAFAGEERSTDGAFTASQIAWDSGGYVVTFTVYETRLHAALRLAEKISSVSQQQWDAAMTAASAD